MGRLWQIMRQEGAASVIGICNDSEPGDLANGTLNDYGIGCGLQQKEEYGKDISGNHYHGERKSYEG